MEIFLFSFSPLFLSFAKFLEVKIYVLYNVKYGKDFMFLSMVHQCLASFRKTTLTHICM